jgi:6-phosphogluconolactonase
MESIKLKISNLAKLAFLIFTLFFLNACTKQEKQFLVYVGTYTGNGSEGIYAYRFNPTNGTLTALGLVAKTENPSFLAIDSAGSFLYSVNELDTFQNQNTGAVSVFKIDKKTGSLTLLQQVSSLGAAPAHLSLDKSGRYLLVANYNGGNVAVFPIASDGKLGDQTALVQNSGSSVNKDRQSSPHAHFIRVTANNKFALTADLGVDKVYINAFDANRGTLVAVDSGFINMQPGSGPRHIAYTPSDKFVYVLNELTSTVSVFYFDPETGSMKVGKTISTLPTNFDGINSTAEIRTNASGTFLYVSNRGDNSIAQYAINSEDGNLTLVAWISSGGKTPRNFEIDPTGQWLFAANQNSDNIVIFRIDENTGQLKHAAEYSGIVSPVCIQFMSVD